MSGVVPNHVSMEADCCFFHPPPPEEAASAAGVRLFVLLGDGYTVQLCLIRASHPRVADTIHMVKNAGSRWFNLIFPEQISEI